MKTGLEYKIPMRVITHADLGFGVHTWKTGELNGITAGHIRSILSIKETVEEGKSTRQWLFEVGGPESFTGYLMSIWDWKRSGMEKRWSTFGPHQYFEIMFGDNYTRFDNPSFELRKSPLN